MDFPFSISTNPLLFRHFPVFFCMKRIMLFFSHKFEIFYSVVFFLAIYMMHIFMRQKKSSKIFFHNKPMFSDGIATRFVRMIKNINFNISLRVYSSSTFPMTTIFSFKISRFKHFKPTLFTTPRNAIFAFKKFFAINTSFHTYYNTFNWGEMQWE